MYDLRGKMTKFIRTLYQHKGELSRAMVMRECYMDFSAGELAALAETLHTAGGLRITRDGKGQVIYILEKEMMDAVREEIARGHANSGGPVL